MSAGSRGLADRVLSYALQRPPRLAHTRLICLDGPGGTGKTTLAAGIALRRRDTVVVHVDDLLHGWGGLAGIAESLHRLCAPLAAGATGWYREYDWRAGRPGPLVPVPPRPLLVLEGVGAGTPLLAPWRTTLVWLEAPRGERVARGIARDAVEAQEEWRRWGVGEDALAARDRVRERANLRFWTGAGA